MDRGSPPTASSADLGDFLANATPVAFYVRRSLGSGPIRFAVEDRSAAGLSTGDGFSTSPSGEFRRMGSAGLYFAEERPLDPLGAVSPPPIERESILWSLKPEGESLKTYLPILSMGIGVVLIVLGIGVLVANQDPIGWFEIILGLVLLIGPVVLAWGRIRAARARELAERKEREEIVARHRQLVGEFAKQLETLPDNHDAATLDRLRRDREGKDIPYEAVAPVARHAALRTAFRILARIRELRAEGVATEIDRVTDAVGLEETDRNEVKADVYRTVVWHLLADDRMTEEQKARAEELRAALKIDGSLVERELVAIEEFEGLRGLSADNLPSAQSPVTLKFQEACLQSSSGTGVKRVTERVSTPQGKVRRQKWAPTKQTHVVVTPKRLILAEKKETVIQYPEVFGIEIDADEGVLEITTRDRKQPYFLSLRDPIRTARVIDIASVLPAKPKGLI